METILSLVKKILDMGWAIDIRSDVSEKVFLLSKNRYFYCYHVCFKDFMMCKDLESEIKEFLNFLIFKLENIENRLKAKESENE